MGLLQNTTRPKVVNKMKFKMINNYWSNFGGAILGYTNCMHYLNLVGSEEILERLYYFLINELRADNACEDMNEYSVSSWCEFEDDYDEDCDDSDDEYQVMCVLKQLMC